MTKGSFPAIDILLATYHGEKYLEEQLNSIFTQTKQDFRLLIRDDGSRDRTLPIIEEYRTRFPEQIVSLSYDASLGVIGNFATLLANATAPYIAFADQDDIWLPEKLEKTWKKLVAMERLYGPSTPLLVHTDLCVVDASAKTLSPSFWKYIHVHPHKRETLAPLLAQNVVTGCTMMINRALQQEVPSIPHEALMHDHWLALVAAGLGKIGTLYEAPILYRQHGGNLVGANRYPRSLFRKMKESFCNREKRGLFFRRLQRQAACFSSLYQECLVSHDRMALDDFLSLPSLRPLRRLSLLNKHNFWYDGILRKIPQLAFFLQSSI